MRVWAERVYEQVVGSTGRAKFELRDGKPVLVKSLDYLFVDDAAGKPVGILLFIGRRPIACFGNSDGDQTMLEYTTIDNPRPSFGLIVHHTDADRESAYDSNPKSSSKLVSTSMAQRKISPRHQHVPTDEAVIACTVRTKTPREDQTNALRSARG